MNYSECKNMERMNSKSFSIVRKIREELDDFVGQSNAIATEEFDDLSIAIAKRIAK